MPEPQPLAVLSNQLLELYKAGDYYGVINRIDHYFQTAPVNGKSLGLLLLKAAAQTELNSPYGAVGPYQQGLPVIRAILNVRRRDYAPIFFSLGELYHRDREFDKAIAVINEGLALDSQDLFAQIMLGEYFIDAGQRERAVTHLRELLDAPGLVEEQRVVVQMKLRRLGASETFPAPDQAGFERQPFYPDFSIQLLPVNGYNPSVRLRDLCRLLESKFLMPCRVLDPVQLDERVIWNDRRKQYDAIAILGLLYGRYGELRRHRSVLMAFTGKDLYAPRTNYVFSLQNTSRGIGVVSSKRFVSTVAPTYEPEIIPTRRMGIQAISTLASLLGFERATKPQCPTAYPASLEEFLQKGSTLCASTVAQRDSFLRQNGGSPGRFDDNQIQEIELLYVRYYFK